MNHAETQGAPLAADGGAEARRIARELREKAHGALGDAIARADGQAFEAVRIALNARARDAVLRPLREALRALGQARGEHARQPFEAEDGV